jgi:hypothetical protein
MVIQDEVIAKADPSVYGAAAGGGLIPALIDGAITRARQEHLQTAMNSFYETVDDYDFRARYWPQLKTQLQQHYPLKITEIVTTPRSLTNKSFQSMRQTLSADEAYLLLITDYSFSTDLRSLNVSTTAQLWDKAAEKPLYKNRVNYQSEPLGDGNEKSALAWSEDHGKLFMAKLDEGIRETLAMLSLDVSDTPSAKSEKIDAKYNFGANAPSSKKSMQGDLLERHGDRVVIRDSVGFLYSIKP